MAKDSWNTSLHCDHAQHDRTASSAPESLPHCFNDPRFFVYISDTEQKLWEELQAGFLPPSILPISSFSENWDLHYAHDALHLIFCDSRFPDKLKHLLCERPNIAFFLTYDGPDELDKAPLERFFLGFAKSPLRLSEWRHAVSVGYSLLKKQTEAYQYTLQLAGKAERVYKITTIGAMLSREKETSLLCEKILSAARDLTNAEAGTMFLIEEAPNQRSLLFSHAQNDKIQYPFEKFSIPIDKKSIAGYVATMGEALNIPDVYQPKPGTPYRFGDDVDRKTGYHTVSMLTIPLKTIYDEILGVIQLINKRSPQDPNRMIPFDVEDESLLESFSSQAASALLNARLYHDIKNLLEGFLQASVNAIDSRDPSTKGHSIRVAVLTTALAEAVNSETEGPYATLSFTDDELMQIKYAALLHDFGKIGVPEKLFAKAKKLFPETFEAILHRFENIKNGLILKRIQNYLSGKSAASEAPKAIENEIERIDRDFQTYAQTIIRSNEPTILAEGDFAQIRTIQSLIYETPAGNNPFLTEEEAESLSIPKGSLTPKEREAIEHHIIHSHTFLKCIPWTKQLHRIPEIVIGHHEKPNGTGYPYGKKGDEIPIESRMMAIADVYDALTAHDRAYKKAVPKEKALAILSKEAEANALDKSLFEIFMKYKIYDKVSET